MLKEILTRYWQVCIFKQTPANTPHSPLLMYFSAGMYFILLVTGWNFAAFHSSLPWTKPIIPSLLIIILYLLYNYSLFWQLKLFERFVRAMTALLFCYCIIHILYLPILYSMIFFIDLKQNSSESHAFAMIYLVAILLIAVWKFLLTVYIYRESLSITLFQAIMASIGLQAINFLTLSFWR